MPQNQDYIVRFPDGSSKTYPAGTNMDDPAIKSELAQEFATRSQSQRGQRIGPPSSPFTPPGPQIERPGKESGNFGEAAGDMVSFFGGLVPAPQVRYPLVSGGGALSAYSRGENPLVGAGKEAAMEGAFGTLGKVIPSAFARLANWTGGAGQTIRDPAGTVAAQMRERTRQQAKPLGRAIPPGAQTRLARTKEEVGKQLEDFEKGRGERIPVTEYQGALDPQRAKAGKVENPGPFRQGLDERELNFVSDQAAEIAGLPYDQVRAFAQKNPQAFATWASGQQHTVREAGELGRAVRSKGQDVFNVREKGVFLPADVKESAQGSIEMGQNVLQQLEAALPPKARAEWRSMVDRYRDLQRMQQLNNALRGGGGTFTGPGAMGALGIRGAAGAGAAGLLSSLGLIEPSTAAMLIGGSAFASPANIFRTGSMTGRALEWTPSAVRGTRIVDHAKKDDEKKPTQLRKR